MTEHLTPGEIVAFQSRSLPPADLFRVWSHAALCDVCSAQLRRPVALGLQTALARASFEVPHLTYEQMESYVDDRLNNPERVAAEEHLAACGGCAGDVHGLIELRDAAVQTGRAGSALLPARRRASLWSAGFGWGAGLAFACLLAGVAFFRVHHAQPQTGNIATTAPAGQPPPEDGLRDGQRLLHVKDGSVSGLDGLPPTYQAPVLTALASGRLDLPVSAAPKPKASAVLMGDGSPLSKVRLLSPTSEVVQEQSPTLRWTPEQDALYRVTVGDRDFNQVAQSGWLRESSWHLPVALQRGKTYSWQLTVRIHGKDIAVPAPPQPAAQFQVLSTQSETDLQHMRLQFGDSHLVMGTAYTRCGLWAEAKDEFMELARQNPQSPVANDLLKNLDRLRQNGSPAKR